jgi:hypothetical protein
VCCHDALSCFNNLLKQSWSGTCVFDIECLGAAARHAKDSQEMLLPLFQAHKTSGLRGWGYQKYRHDRILEGMCVAAAILSHALCDALNSSRCKFFRCLCDYTACSCRRYYFFAEQRPCKRAVPFPVSCPCAPGSSIHRHVCCSCCIDSGAAVQIMCCGIATVAAFVGSGQHA